MTGGQARRLGPVTVHRVWVRNLRYGEIKRPSRGRASADSLEHILELAPSSISAPTEQTRLVEDLGYHSLALLELAFALEDKFALPAMDAEQAQKIGTMLDVEEYVRTFRARD